MDAMVLIGIVGLAVVTACLLIELIVEIER